MKKFLKRLLILILSLSPSAVYATGKGLPPVDNQTVISIGGVKADGTIVPILTDSSGSMFVNTSTPPVTPITFQVVEANPRTQLPAHSVTACIIQAYTANIGAIYVGDGTVTNVSGANQGIKLDQDAVFSVSVSDSSQLYIAADTIGDGAAVFCN